ncbi:unnamed protein product [Albugo candida]|uniref:Uncharacterized protein n=1 Tax=Albugo candida TaxID=65357 RepID=A0A024G0D4_9STRA|nr:unnamed protein product [Albugo candida]|eukprot:CCI40302.1 unnamed protein product [Albugo candida]
MSCDLRSVLRVCVRISWKACLTVKLISADMFVDLSECSLFQGHHVLSRGILGSIVDDGVLKCMKNYSIASGKLQLSIVYSSGYLAMCSHISCSCSAIRAGFLS